MLILVLVYLGSFAKEIKERVMNGEVEGYVLNGNTPFVFKYHTDFIIYSLHNATESNISDVLKNVHIFEIRDLESRQEIINDIVKKIENGFYKVDNNFNRGLLGINDILIAAAKRDISLLLDTDIDFRMMPYEKQLEIYNLYKSSDIPEELREKLDKKMMQISMYFLDEVRKYLDANDTEHEFENIDSLDFKGIQISDEEQKEIAKGLVSNGYKITKNTPKELHSNKYLIAELIMQDRNIVEKLPIIDVQSILDWDFLRNNRKYLEELSFLFEAVPNRFTEIIKNIGMEEFLEQGESLGNCVEYLPYLNLDYKKISVNDTRNKMIEWIALGSIVPSEKIERFNDVKITEEEILKLLENMQSIYSDQEIMMFFLEINPDFILYYTGNLPEVFQKAVNEGFELDEDDVDNAMSNIFYSDVIFMDVIKRGQKNLYEFYEGNNEEIFKGMAKTGYFNELVDIAIIDLLDTHYNFACSQAIMSELIKINPEYIRYYQGESIELLLEAVKRGYKISFETIKRNRYYRENDSLFEQLLEQNIQYIELYEGFNEQIFQMAVSKGYFRGITEERIRELLRKNNFCYSDEVAQELVNINPQNICLYRGHNIEIYEMALDRGYDYSLEFIKDRLFLLRK